MKMLAPILIALVGLGAGVGAGVALKPAPETAEAPTAEACAAEDGHGDAGAGGGCAPSSAADPFAPVAAPHDDGHAGETASVPLDKPFVVPVFGDGKVVAMVVISVAVAVPTEGESKVEAAQPRLRDSFLAVMFRHANSGGFDGAFTEGRKMDDLRAALLVAAHDVFPEMGVSEVLITEIARQDV